MHPDAPAAMMMTKRSEVLEGLVFMVELSFMRQLQGFLNQGFAEIGTGIHDS
jgi:hypothetical protein